MSYQQTQHVKSILKLRWHANIGKFQRHIYVFFWCNLFDRRIIEVILELFIDIISIDRKLTELQRDSIDVFLKDKKSWSL